MSVVSRRIQRRFPKAFAKMSMVSGDEQISLPRRVYTNSWVQIVLISMICFCCPGVCNSSCSCSDSVGY